MPAARRRIEPLIRICICGGGNLAHALAGIIGANPAIEVRVLTRRPAEWGRQITVFLKDKHVLVGRLANVSSDPSVVVRSSDIVLLAVPAFARKEVLERVSAHVGMRTWIGSFPGTEGFDWLARSIVGARCKVFGVQRTPYICRTLEHGSSVQISGIRPALHLSALPKYGTPKISALLSTALNLTVVALPNYLSVTLTPGNSIFHPARLYSLFQNFQVGGKLDRELYFYEGWDDCATQTYLACDQEIQAVVRKLPVDLTLVTPLLIHYDAASPAEITRQIRSSPALKGIKVPLRPLSNGFEPDFTHRFFTEDIAYGLLSLRAIAELAEVSTPAMCSILRWGQERMGRQFVGDDGSLIDLNGDLPLPVNYGIETITELVRRSLA